MSDLVPIPQPLSQEARIAALAHGFVQAHTSPNTRLAYERDLTLYLDWCAQRGLNPLTDVRYGHVQHWLRELQETPRETGRPDSSTTAERRRATVSSWYTWLIRHEQAERNPADLDPRDRPARNSQPTPALEDSVVKALLAAADASGSARTAALVWLLVYSGGRVGAVLNADISRIGLDRGHPVIWLLEKGAKRGRVTLVPPLWERIVHYLRERPDIEQLPALPGAPASQVAKRLFVTKTGGKLFTADLTDLLRRLAKTAGLPPEIADRITPHWLRATYITGSLEQGADLRQVQYEVGHASPLTTLRYDRGNPHPAKSSGYTLMERFSPDAEKGPAHDDQQEDR